MARPTKLTPEIQDKIVNFVSQGNYRSVAAQAVGIHPDTFHTWMTKERQPYLRFRMAILEAEANAQRLMVSCVMKAAIGGEWRAALEYLSRKFPDEWAATQKNQNRHVNRDGDDVSPVSGVLFMPAPVDEDEWQRMADKYKSLQVDPTIDDAIEYDNE